MISHQIPNKPYEKIRTDLFETDNQTYIITVDYFSKYPEIMALTNTSSKHIKKALKENFAQQGIPQIVVSDNGLQFRSEKYRRFAEFYNFTPIFSSPQFPKGNGQIERFVQTVKNMIRKCKAQNTDIDREYQLTPNHYAHKSNPTNPNK